MIVINDSQLAPYVIISDDNCWNIYLTGETKSKGITKQYKKRIDTKKSLLEAIKQVVILKISKIDSSNSLKEYVSIFEKSIKKIKDSLMIENIEI